MSVEAVGSNDNSDEAIINAATDNSTLDEAYGNLAFMGMDDASGASIGSSSGGGNSTSMIDFTEDPATTNAELESNSTVQKQIQSSEALEQTLRTSGVNEKVSSPMDLFSKGPGPENIGKLL